MSRCSMGPIGREPPDGAGAGPSRSEVTSGRGTGATVSTWIPVCGTPATGCWCGPIGFSTPSTSHTAACRWPPWSTAVACRGRPRTARRPGWWSWGGWVGATGTTTSVTGCSSWRAWLPRAVSCATSRGCSARFMAPGLPRPPSGRARGPVTPVDLTDGGTPRNPDQLVGLEHVETEPEGSRWLAMAGRAHAAGASARPNVAASESGPALTCRNVSPSVTWQRTGRTGQTVTGPPSWVIGVRASGQRRVSAKGPARPSSRVPAIALWTVLRHTTLRQHRAVQGPLPAVPCVAVGVVTVQPSAHPPARYAGHTNASPPRRWRSRTAWAAPTSAPRDDPLDGQGCHPGVEVDQPAAEGQPDRESEGGRRRPGGRRTTVRPHRPRLHGTEQRAGDQATGRGGPIVARIVWVKR